MWPGKMAEGVRKKKDCWKTQRVLVDNSGVPDGSWTDDEVRAWLEWWRPEEELRTVCRCIGLEAKMQASKKKQHSWGTATAMRGALRDYYDSPVQGAPPLRLTTADLGLEARQPEPEPEQEPEPVGRGKWQMMTLLIMAAPSPTAHHDAAAAGARLGGR